MTSKWSIVPNSTSLIQGDSNQNLKFILAITVNVCISDPILVKPKRIWEQSVFSKNFKQTAEKCKQFFGNLKKKKKWQP